MAKRSRGLIGESEPLRIVWRKSSVSDSQGIECVELAHVRGIILVRDSKKPLGSRLAFPSDTWHHLLADIRRTSRASAQDELSET
jgi:hypothetical protein